MTGVQTCALPILGRGTETAEQVAKRFGKAKEEIAKAVRYDYLIINDEIEKCAEEFINIVKCEKLKVHYESNKKLIEQLI